MQIKPNEIIGTVKLKDGLYLGDHYAAQVLLHFINFFIILYIIRI